MSGISEVTEDWFDVFSEDGRLIYSSHVPPGTAQKLREEKENTLQE